MRRTFASLAILAVLADPRSAQAETESLPLELAWDAPDGCPGASFVTAHVEHILRGSSAARTKVAARGKIERTKDARLRLALSIRTDDVEETRSLEASTCTALAHAAAVVVALAIDPSHEEAQVEAEPEPPVSDDEPTTSMTSSPRRTSLVPVPVPAPSSTIERPPIMPPAPGDATRIAVGAGGAIVSGVLPEMGGGVGFSATLRLRRLRVGVVGTYWLRQSPTFERGAGASFDMLQAGGFGAHLWSLGPVALGPSIGAEAIHVDLQGFGIRSPRATSVTWPTAVLGARLEARLLPRLELFARAEALFPLGAPTFTLGTVGDARRLHEPGLIAPRGSVGIEIVLP